MADIHIEDFCKDAARILVQLFNQFPRPHQCVCGRHRRCRPQMNMDCCDRHMACFRTMLWLAEGAIFVTLTPCVRAIDQATLTQIFIPAVSDQPRQSICSVIPCCATKILKIRQNSPAGRIAFEKNQYQSRTKSNHSSSSTRIYRVMQTLFSPKIRDYKSLNSQRSKPENRRTQHKWG